MYRQWNTIHSLKEGNSTIRENKDESWGYYAKWNKPVTKRQILHDSTNMRFVELFKLIKT